MRSILTGVAAALLTASLAQAQNVKNQNTGLSYPTIQAAIDAAATTGGDVLVMEVASHTEGGGGPIVFSKSLTLKGLPTTLMPAASTGSVGDGRAWVMTDAGTICSFQNLTFDGTGNDVWQAMRFKGDGTVRGCDFNDIVHPGFQGTGIVALGTDQTANVTVQDCDFEDMGRIGVLFFGDQSFDCQVDGMTYTGKGSGNHLDYAVEVGGGAAGTVRGLTATACEGVVDSLYFSAAVSCSTFYGPGSNVEVLDSNLTNNQAAVGVGANGSDTSTVRVAQCTITGNKVGVSNVSQINSVDARLNWWGASGGPRDDCGTFENDINNCFFSPICTSGTDGRNQLPVGFLGDAVTENVIYCRWLEAPPNEVGTPIDPSICGVIPNSTGLPATLIGEGSSSVLANNLTLVAADLPANQFGYFLLSDATGFIDLPAAGLSDGYFCLASGGGSQIGRFNGDIRNSGFFGTFSLRIDVNAVPQSSGPPTHPILPTETWYFQAWFRDTPPMSGNNFTNAFGVLFTP